MMNTSAMSRMATYEENIARAGAYGTEGKPAAPATHSSSTMIARSADSVPVKNPNAISPQKAS